MTVWSENSTEWGEAPLFLKATLLPGVTLMVLGSNLISTAVTLVGVARSGDGGAGAGGTGAGGADASGVSFQGM